MSRCKFRPYKEAKKLSLSLNLKSRTEWRKWCTSGNKPVDIPVAPDEAYKKEWIGWGDFLGTGNVSVWNKKFRSFKEARTFVRSLNLKSTEWKEYCSSGKKPDDIPSAPHSAYKNEWKGYADFLGTGDLRTKTFRSFKDARAFARSLRILSSQEWRKYCSSGKRPVDIPYSPDQVYKKEWKGWKDFLGNL